MRHIKALLVLFLLALLPVNSFSQTLSDKATVSLLTCGSGEELYSVFGHTAIRVYDPINHVDTVYNYGTFDFDTPNFYLKFVKGDLQYLLSTSTYDDFIYTYQYYDRDVFEQVLNLSAAQKQNIADELKQTLASEKRFYMYKFIDRNCTTMAADDITSTIGTTLSKEIKDKGKSYREILYSYLDNHFFENLGINLIFGYKTDKISDKLFLPLQLMEGIQNTKVGGKPLTPETLTLYKSTGANKKTSLLNNYYTFSLLLLIAVYFSGKRKVYRTFLAISGVMGVFFTTVGFYSFHAEISQNYNALLINPLFLVLLFFIIKNNSKWIARVCFAGLLCLVIYLIIMINKPHLLLVMPILVVTAVILFRLLMLNRKQLVVTTTVQ